MTDHSALEERLRNAKIKISEKENARTRAQISKEEAEKSLEKIKDTMVNELGVSTGAELKALIADLETKLESELDTIENLLSGEDA